MWHDNETTTDYLNFGVVADACAKLLQQANGQPISIGVSGGWGVGKSSLVRMVAARLNVDADPNKNTYVVVTFNPWLYQDFEGARSALLQMVGDEVLRRASADEGLLKKAKRLLQRINLLRIVQLGGEAAATIATGIPIGLIGRTLAKFGFGDEQGEAADDKAEKDEDWGLLKPAEPVSLPGEIQAFRDALEELLEELKITLVVFVDDLDRCLPQTAISTSGRTHCAVRPAHCVDGAPKHRGTASDAVVRRGRDHSDRTFKHHRQRARLQMRPPIVCLAWPGAWAIQLRRQATPGAYYQGGRPVPAQPAGARCPSSAGSGQDQERSDQPMGREPGAAARLLESHCGHCREERPPVLGGTQQRRGIQAAGMSA